MIGTAPKFINSPYFVPEAGNWHLKDGAPKEVVEEFNEFLRLKKEINQKTNFSKIVEEVNK